MDQFPFQFSIKRENKKQINIPKFSYHRSTENESSKSSLTFPKHIVILQRESFRLIIKRKYGFAIKQKWRCACLYYYALMEKRIKFHQARLLYIFQIVSTEKNIKLIPECIHHAIRNFILSHDAFPIVLKNTACPSYAVAEWDGGALRSFRKSYYNEKLDVSPPRGISNTGGTTVMQSNIYHRDEPGRNKGRAQ